MMSSNLDRRWGLVARIARWVRRGDAVGFSVGPWPGDRAVSRINAAQIALWAVFAGAVLMKTGHFTYDQAYFYEMSVRVAERFRPAAYGPFVSGLMPAPLTPGGLLYDVLSIPFFFVRDPRWGMAWIDLLAALGALLLDRALRRFATPPSVRLALVTIQTWGLFHARLTSTFWNADVFLFATPTMLYVTARSLTARRAWPLGLLFGLLGALSMQIHVSGVLAIGACVLILALWNPGVLGLRWIGATALGLMAGYLPFVVAEVRSGWVDWKLLQASAPHAHSISMETLKQCLLAPVSYASHLNSPDQAWPPFHTWTDRLVGWSGWAAGAAALAGLATAFELKVVSTAVLAAVPAFLAASNRGYIAHYVAAVMPFLGLWAAAGVALALSNRYARPIGIAYLAAYALSGAALLVAQWNDQWVVWPNNPWNGFPVSSQVAKTERALASHRPYFSRPGDELAFPQAVLAKRLYGKDLYFSVAGGTCTAEILLSGLGPPFAPPPHTRVFPLSPNSVFVCR
jgi:hypothetical protein